MDSNTQDIIFDRFTKIESDNNKLYRGAGLGLTISKKLVELLNGEIWVDSNLGSGSSFFFILPALNNNYIDHETIRNIEVLNFIDENNCFANKEILIVEDNTSNFELLKAILKKTNANLTWSKNGIEAIDYCKMNVPDAILLDIKMPKMDGYETVKHLREMKITVPIIAQTAFARIEDEKKILNCGFDSYLSKPIEKKKLISLLAKYFSK
jgi:CheY-like chemotaxis protein